MSNGLVAALQCFCLARRGSCVIACADQQLVKSREWEEGQVESAGWAHHGSYLYINKTAAANDVEIVDAVDDYKVLHVCKGDSPVRFVAFSPLSTYMVVWYRHDADRNPNNLVVWKVDTGQIVCRYSLRALAHTKWPHLHWSSKETYVCRQVSNEIQVFANCGGNVVDNAPTYRLHLDKIESFLLSPEVDDTTLIATFVPAVKSAPSVCSIYDITKIPLTAAARPTAICSRRFYQAQEVQFLWSFDAKALLALASTDTDKSGKSYYGSNTLHFMKSDGTYDALLVPPDEGPVHDVQWSPTACEFVLCKGPMPPQLSLCDGAKGAPILSFGKARRNTIRWNKFGRLIVLGGFGNLAGEVDVWDRSNNSKIGSFQAPCSVLCEFAPDGRHLMTATTSPR
eukprot:GHVS01013047.1.p1 GENE.GHVS01013047.1~~GHVS01013047.1.p1  ORF type:complete len:397 (+),score=49.38 GHVS01013047.1:288-1478(+)